MQQWFGQAYERLAGELFEVARGIRARPALAYFMAPLIVAFALFLHLAIISVGVPFVTFMPAVLLVCLLAGTGPGIAAALISALLAWFTFLQNPMGPQWTDGSRVLALTLFFVTAMICIVVVETLYRAWMGQLAGKLIADATLRELQHRVANNLQFVGSILALQKRKVEKDLALGPATLEDAARRLLAMARINRSVYDPKRPADFLNRLFVDLCRDATRSARIRAVTCRTEATAAADWPAESLVLLCQLFGEILANSVTHALGGRDALALAVSIEALPEEWRFVVGDDGPGYPEGLDPAGQHGLGLTIIRGLVDQLRGKLAVTNDGGAVTIITMPRFSLKG